MATPSGFDDPGIGFDDPNVGFDGTIGPSGLPVVTSVVPNSGPDSGGQTVTINGTGFGGTPTPTNRFTFNDSGWSIPIGEITPNPTAVLNRIQATGATMLRTDAYWAALQPTGPLGPGLNDTFSSSAIADLDAVVNGAATRGIHVVLCLSYSPQWARPGFTASDHIPPTRDLATYADYANVAYLLAARYGNKVTLEAWNEPNISNFWQQPASTSTTGAINSPDVVEYSKLLKATYTAIKTGVVAGRSARTAHPEVLVITGGTSPATGDGSGAGNYAPISFLLNIIYYAHDSFDHVAHHPYIWEDPPALNQSWNPMQQTALLWSGLKTYGRADADIWATEVGIISRPDISGSDPASITPGGISGIEGYVTGAPGPGYNTAERAINYTLAATRAQQIADAWRSTGHYDPDQGRYYTGPMCVFKLNDTHAPTDWTGSDEHHFGAFEGPGYAGAAKPHESVWAAMFGSSVPSPGFLVGIATGAGIPSAQDIVDYSNAKAKVVRTSAATWSALNPTLDGSLPASATRDALDAYIQGCNFAGIKVILGVSGGSQQSGAGGPGMNSQTTAFATFCINIAARYQHGGPNGEIECIEIGNEPNFIKWDATPDPAAYANLMSLVYAGVTALGANRPLVMIGGIAGSAQDGAGGMSMSNWTTGLYAAWNASGDSNPYPYDTWNTHRYTYPKSPSESIASGTLRGWVASTTGIPGTPGSQAIREANGDGAKPHACTEYGIPTPLNSTSPPMNASTWVSIMSDAITHYGNEPAPCYFCYFSDVDKGITGTGNTDPTYQDHELWFGLWTRDNATPANYTPKPTIFAQFQAFATDPAQQQQPQQQAPRQAPQQAPTTVTVGGTLATIISITDTQIVITTPAHSAGTVHVNVTTAAGTSLSTTLDLYTYTTVAVPGVPTITFIAPASGPFTGGTVVTVSGSDLGFVSAVAFDGIAAQFSLVDDQTLTTISPGHAPGAVDIRVTAPTGQSAITAADVFIYRPPTPPQTRKWQILARGADNVPSAQVEDFTALDFIIRERATGAFILTIPAFSPAAVELGRARAGIIVLADDEVVFSGPIRNRHRSSHGGVEQLVLSGADDMVWLEARRAHMQPHTDAPPYDTQAFDIRTGLCSTVLSQYVAVNAGQSALARRAVPGLIMGPDLGIGSTVTGGARMQTLLDLMQPLALASTPQVSFRIRQSGQALIFTTSLPTDRSQKAIFQAAAGTLGDYDYERTAAAANYVYAGGAGGLTQRLFVEAEDGADIDEWGLYEEFFGQPDLTTAADLSQAAHAEVTAQTGTFRMDLSIIDTAGLAWLKDYNLGDRVGVVLDGVYLTEQIREIHVELGPNGDDENITPSVASPTPKASVREQQIFQTIRHLQGRVANLERS